MSLNLKQGRETQHIVGNHQIYLAATEHADAAELISRSFGQGPEALFLPYLLLCSFAVELYLKALNSEEIADRIAMTDPDWPLFEGFEEQGVTWQRLADRSRSRGHKLLELFDAMDEPIRDELSQCYCQTPVVRDANSLRDALGRYNDLFERVRYCFEPGNQPKVDDVPGLLRLVRLIGKYVESKDERGKFLHRMKSQHREQP